MLRQRFGAEKDSLKKFEESVAFAPLFARERSKLYPRFDPLLYELTYAVSADLGFGLTDSPTGVAMMRRDPYRPWTAGPFEQVHPGPGSSVPDEQVV